MMTEQQILVALAEIIEQIVGIPACEVKSDKHFTNDLDIDSLSIVEIAVAAQDRWDTEISDDELKNLSTVQDVINCVHRTMQVNLGELERAHQV